MEENNNKQENNQSSSNSNQTSPSSNMSPNMLAAVANVVPPITSFIVLNMEKDNEFVRFYAMQGTIFGVISFVASFLSGSLSIIGIGLILSPIIFIVSLYFWIMLMYKAFNNEEYEIPYIGEIARKQLAQQSEQK